MLSELNFALSDSSFLILVVSGCGLLLEDQTVIRLILLLEISLAATIGYTLAAFEYSSMFSFIFVIVILVVAAVESIILLCFVVVLYRLETMADLVRLAPMQI